MSPLSRRDLFRLAGVGAAGVGLGRFLMDCGPGAASAAAGAPTTAAATAPASTTASTALAAMAAMNTSSSPDLGIRQLVVVELSGGNDGMSTLVPRGMGRYHDLRPRTAVPDDQLIGIDDTFALHAALGPLWERGLAVLMGVGTDQPDGSHFEMMARWWSGDPSGTSATGTGFLGRLCDAIGDPAAPVTGLSVGSGGSPALLAEKVTTMALPGLDGMSVFSHQDPNDVLLTAFQEAMAEMAAAGDEPRMLAIARKSYADAIALAGRLRGAEAPGADGYPDGELGRGLALAAQLLTNVEGLRVVHVPAHLDFDTHDDHVGRYPDMIGKVGGAIDRFLGDLEERGAADRVLVMTTSEFGRTVRDNGSYGLDHGTASVAMLAGAGIVPGLHGEHPSLDRLDDQDQLIATVGFERYYATVAERWFGIPATDVIATPGVSPIEGLLR
jgi:uncharacterized protein (DUF1501 family)